MHLLREIVTISALAAFAWCVLLKRLFSQKLIAFDDSASQERLQAVFSERELDFDWLRHVGFVPVGVLHLDKMIDPFTVTWKLAKERTYLGMMVRKNGPVTFEIWSVFDRGSLTTGNSKGLHMFPPPPDYWVQSFSTDSVEELWRRHVAGLEFLTTRLGQRPSKLEISVEEEAAQRLGAATNYLFSFWFWQFRVFFWRLLRVKRRHGLTVQEQFDAGRRTVDEPFLSGDVRT